MHSLSLVRPSTMKHPIPACSTVHSNPMTWNLLAVPRHPYYVFATHSHDNLGPQDTCPSLGCKYTTTDFVMALFLTVCRLCCTLTE